MVESASVELQPGVLLAGKYKVEWLLGRGGMGAVYAVQHEALSRRVALKVLLSDVAQNPEAVQRFMNEARAAARLDSEHIARVIDFGMLEENVPFMVMEYLEGQDLAEVLQARGPLPIGEAVTYVIEACEGIAEAHAQGVIHRDLKPSNLYLARAKGGSRKVKVLDFGISKISNDSLSKGLTSTRAMLGTPLYMAPEQFARPKEIDSRSDIWQLGVNLYELLAGTPPFVFDTIGEQIHAVMHEPVPPLTAKRPEVPAELEQAILHCLERDVSRRFATVADFARAIAPFGGEGYAAAGTRTMDSMTLGRTPAPGQGWPTPSRQPWFNQSSPSTASRGSPFTPPTTASRSNGLKVAAAAGGLVIVGGIVLTMTFALRDHSDRPVAATSPPSAIATALPLPLPSDVPPPKSATAPLPSATPTEPAPAASSASSPPTSPPAAPSDAVSGNAPHKPRTHSAGAGASPSRPPAAASSVPPHSLDQLPDNSRQ